MLKIYDAEKLFHILGSRAEQSVIAERNCIPFLFEEKASGDVYVVQPDGAFHKTNRELHNMDGHWKGFAFDKYHEASAIAAAATTGAIITAMATVKSAMRKLGPEKENYAALGYGPSISRIQAYLMPPEFAGARIFEKDWGPKNALVQVKPATQILVRIVGSRVDCYPDDKTALDLWNKLNEPAVSGPALVAQLPQLKMEELQQALMPEGLGSQPAIRLTFER